MNIINKLSHSCFQSSFIGLQLCTRSKIALKTKNYPGPWLMSVMLTSRRMEIRSTADPGQPGQKVTNTPIQ
jgi:hypothetical protein